MARRPQTSSAQVASTIGMRRSDRVKAQVANGKRLESVAIAPAPKRVKPNPKKEEREEDDDDEDTNYGKKTIAQLTNIAKDRGITAALDAAKSRRRKSMIIASIEEFDAQERQEREEQLQEKEQDRLEHLERELEASRDLPYPPIPELLEKGGTMKPKRNGKDVKNWYEPDTKVKSSKNDRYWVFKKNIGEGSYGTCTLWVKSDGKVIVDRIVLKDQVIEEHSLNRMTWAFDGGDHVRPMEADIHARLWERNNQSILKYCGFRYDDETHVFRLYTEYARFGTLRKLMDKYATNDTKVGAWNRKADRTHSRDNCIPEPFIWYVARELLSAAKTMASGFRSDETTASDDDREEWAEILHLDIKPHNILMADPDPDTEDEKAKQYGWPKIQVTDFGVSVELRPEWKNPQDLTGRGTQGYQAPEQLRQIKRDPKEYPIQQLCAKTNIWGIGAVLYDLMNPRIHKKEHGEQSGGPILTDSTNASRSRIGYHEDLIASGQKQLAWRMVPKDESRSSNRSSKSVESDHVNAYSDGLVDFVTQCLEFLPENRPDLEEMDETIEDNLDQWYASTKDYWSKVDHLDFETCILKLKKPLKDDYAIGHKQAVVEGVEVAALGGGEAEEHDVEEEERLE